MAEKVTAKVKSPTGRTVTVSGPTQAIVDAKLAVMVGTLTSENDSKPVTTPGTLAAASGPYDDAVLTILKAGKSENIQLQNVTDAVKLVGSNGVIDITKPTIIAIATAEGGTIVSGRYTRG